MELALTTQKQKLLSNCSRYIKHTTKHNANKQKLIKTTAREVLEVQQ